MSNLIKDRIMQFIFVFLVLFIVGYFIKSLDLNIIKSLVLSFVVTCVDFLIYIIRKSKKVKKWNYRAICWTNRVNKHHL